MGVSAVIENGEIVTSASQSSISSATSSSSSVNKDDFLQLLVAQMQYQDPLEPTDNTEWVSQYAQFSQVEELQNMSSSMELTRASALVGQTVIMNVSKSDGSSTTIEGNVDYVSYEAGKAYLSIGGSLYSMNDLSYVVDKEYEANSNAAEEFLKTLDKLPALANLSYSDKAAVVEAYSLYSNLSDSALEMVGDANATKLKQYVNRMSELVAANESE